MIGKLEGIVENKEDSSAIFLVNGVGYLVSCSAKTMEHCVPGDKVAIFVETIVREDSISLYGFHNQEEKKAFNILHSINGIGPRMALTVLSSYLPSQISSAVQNKDKNAFQMLSGIGPKLAERMLVELKGKNISVGNVEDISSPNSEIMNDAITALVGLGIPKNEVTNLVKEIMSEEQNISIDNLIRKALQKRNTQ